MAALVTHVQVPVDCACVNDGTPQCRDEATFGSAVRPANNGSNQPYMQGVFAVHPHLFEPIPKVPYGR